MKDVTDTTTATDLVLATGADIAALFRQDSGLDDVISRIEADSRSQAFDLTTAKGRKACASLAHKIARSKTALDSAGKDLNAAKRAEIAVVDAERRKARDRLDALKAEVRKPLDDWEAAEEKRKAAHVEAMKVFDTSHSSSMDAPEVIRATLAAVEAAPMGECWDEFEEEAAEKRRIALDWHRNNLAVSEKRVADEAELARLRAEAEERARRDAEEAAAKEAAERAERERKEAEARRIEAEKADAARREQAEREKAEAAERAQVEAEERAKAEAKAAEERHARELAEAKAREERAAQAERDRIAEEQRRAAESRAKREADEAHRARIKGDIVEALTTMRGAATPEAIADALMAGRIPHVEVTL